MTVTYKWKPGAGNEPAPKNVIVATTAGVSAAGTATGSYNDPKPPKNVASASCGLSGPGINNYSNQNLPGPFPGSFFAVAGSSGTQYEVQDGASPTAKATMSGGASSSLYTSFSATATPVRVNLVGATPDANKNLNVLTGQQIKSTITGCSVKPGTYLWTVSGGAPFRTFTHNVAGGQKYDLDQSDYTAPEGDFFTADKGAVTISCSCTAVFPDKTTQAVTAQALPVTSVKPRVTSWDIVSASVRFDREPALGPTNAPSFFSPFSLATLAANRHEGQESTVTVATDAPFAGQGTAAFVQLVTPARYIFDVATGKQQHPAPYSDGTAYNGTKALDQLFPVASFAITQTGLYADSPQQGTDSKWTKSTADDTFDTWIMFMPPPAPGNTATTYVPLQKYSWEWKGTAVQEKSGIDWTNIWDLSATFGATPTSSHADTLLFPGWFETAPSTGLSYTP